MTLTRRGARPLLGSRILHPMLAVSLVVLLASCASTVKNPAPLAASVPSANENPPAEYIIQAGDVLSIKFFENQELNEDVRVRPDGRISLQLVNEIVAAGRTPAELTEVISEKYAAEFKRPKAAVIVRSFSHQKVYVTGEVQRPDVIDLVGRTTVLQAISQVSGFKDTARKDEIVLIRKKEDGSAQVFQLNIEGVIAGTDTSQDVVLRPLDIVYVPKSPIANVNQWVEQYISKVVPSFVVFSFDYQVKE